MKDPGRRIASREQADELYLPERYFIESVPLMVNLARNAAHEDAFSYRGLHVGAAALLQSAEGDLDVVSAGNVKTNAGMETVCAETRVLGKANNLGSLRMVGLVVAGPTDGGLIRDILKRDAPTLHCCSKCRVMLKAHSLVESDTPIISVGIEENVFQVHGNEELRKVYAKKKVPQNSEHALNRSFSHRVRLYDSLATGEQALPANKRRTPALLARIALNASL